MVMEKSLQTYGSTQGDISPALARDISPQLLKFLPRLVLARLKPASSMKMNNGGCAAASYSRTLCNRKFIQCTVNIVQHETELQCLHFHIRMGVGMRQMHCQNYKLQARLVLPKTPPNTQLYILLQYSTVKLTCTYS